MESENLSPVQEVEITVLAKIEGNDPENDKIRAETYKELAEADAKQQEAYNNYLKVTNDYEVKKKELLNNRIDKCLDSIVKVSAAAGSAYLGGQLIKSFVHMEETGTWPSNWFSKEFFLGTVRKIFFRH